MEGGGHSPPQDTWFPVNPRGRGGWCRHPPVSCLTEVPEQPRKLKMLVPFHRGSHRRFLVTQPGSSALSVVTRLTCTQAGEVRVSQVACQQVSGDSSMDPSTLRPPASAAPSQDSVGWRSSTVSVSPMVRCWWKLVCQPAPGTAISTVWPGEPRNGEGCRAISQRI